MNTSIASTQDRSIGDHIREWRQHRRVSQLSLALDIELSQKHLSFIESGRSAPSREVVLRIASGLDVPLRVRNLMLLSAGYAPRYLERPLDHPDLAAARSAVEMVLRSYEPFPAIAIDRSWNLVAANDATQMLFNVVQDPALLEPPINVLRGSLHPRGLAPLIENYEEWARNILKRLDSELEATGDAELRELIGELEGLAGLRGRREGREDFAGVFIPLKLRLPGGTATFISITSVLGTPTEVTLSELAIEAFLPADAATSELLRAMASPAGR
jgi:transcriptional regulator with XRE-family HTH domain